MCNGGEMAPLDASSGSSEVFSLFIFSLRSMCLADAALGRKQREVYALGKGKMRMEEGALASVAFSSFIRSFALTYKLSFPL